MINEIDDDTTKFIVTVFKRLKRFGIVCLGEEILEHRIVFQTELCDPDEATVYNALFDDVRELPWK